MIALGMTALIPVKAEDLVYVTVNPCRIVDTREAGGAIAANNFRNFMSYGTSGVLAQQGATGACVNPKDTQRPYAVSAYVLAVPAAESTAGVLTAYPSDQPPPPVGAGSTVNFAAGQITGNTTNITLCTNCPADGDFAILSRNTAEHVVVDVQGYFYPMPTEPQTERFVDNGDGTFSDNETGLMWEKKEAYDGVVDRSNIHDADNIYSWTDTADGDLSNPDGTMFTEFLAQVNKEVTSYFTFPPLANFTDWRIATLWEGYNLSSAFNNACGDESKDPFIRLPCPNIDSIF